MAFDYITASAAEILERAKSLEGLTLGEIPGSSFIATTGATGRHEVGRAVETYFGMPASSKAEADFPGAGIELKVVPLVSSGSELRVKERTVISMIDYVSIAKETWEHAKVRSKLHILFVYFEHLVDEPKKSFPIRKTVLWSPSDEVERFIRADWSEVRRKVRAGKAHELSEADGRLMGPSTKGSGRRVRTKQPFSAEIARTRAFALKPALTRAIYMSAMGKLGTTESLLKKLNVSRIDLFEREVLERFERFENRTILAVGNELGVKDNTSKNYAASVARRALGARSPQAKVLEFELMSLTPRVVRCGSDRMPYEATSFPYFRPWELLEESWEDSALLATIEYMLFVPIIGSDRRTPQRECRFGTPVFWRPEPFEVEAIRSEWEMFRGEIKRGRAKRLTRASETSYIHVRPHGRDARDTVDAPIVGPVVKQSFWLNKEFVQEILFTAG